MKYFIFYDLILTIVGFIMKNEFAVQYGIISFFHDIFFYFYDKREI